MTPTSNNAAPGAEKLLSTETTIRPGLRGVRAYSRPGHPPWVDLHLDANEGTPPPAEILDWSSLIDEGAIGRYPSTANLERQIADRFGVAPGCVLVTAGGDDAIDRACRARLGPGDQIIIPTPTFEMIARYARLAGAEVVTVPWRSGSYPCAAVIGQLTPATGMIAVVSPNNPTGLAACAEDLERLAAAAPRATVLADLAYAEFAERDLTSAALAAQNAVVIRTFSKAGGLAGLRIGYAIGPTPLIAAMRAAGGPFAVSGVSIAAAARLLDYGHAWLTTRVSDVRAQRRLLAAALQSMGVDVEASESNCLLARFRNPSWVCSAMRSLGIAVRAYPDDPELGACLRISCPGGGDISKRITKSLLTTLRPQAILLGMDGVLADARGLAGEDSLIPTRSLLARLASRVPLAMLTGRSRLEAEAFLARHGISDLFRTVVCREDVAATPSAALVRRALERLGMSRAWMVTDSVDDVAAARQARVVPIGIPAAGDSTDLLRAQGAATVLDNLAQVEELLA